MSFQDEIREKFKYLFDDYGFKIDTCNTDKELEEFLVVAVGQRISLKFINDRANFFLDVSFNSKPEHWINFYSLLGKLKEKGCLKENFKPINKIDNVKSYLKKNIDIISKTGIDTFN